MRILITNERIDQRAGSDLFCRDLARGLQSRGHFVIAYGSDKRQLERMLERDSIPVVVNLEKLPFRPDVIHARHHLDAMTAVMALPGVPAIHHCLGPAWATLIPKHPRIFRYVAPSVGVAASLASEGIASEQTDTILHAFDPDRFTKVRTPPSVPTRALIYDDVLSSDSLVVQTIVSELQSAGMAVELSGRRFGRAIEDPERQLLKYDLVFASGRKGIEAIACGCSVIMVGPNGCGELVESSNFEALRATNFARPGEPIFAAAEVIARFFGEYSPPTSIDLAERIRRVASFDSFILEIENSYQAAITANDGYELDFDAEDRAASTYLQALGMLIKGMDRVQKSEGNLPMSAASRFLEVAAKLEAIELDLQKAWWPDQRGD